MSPKLEKVTPRNGKIALSVCWIGMGIALVSGISSDILHIFPHLGIVSILSLAIGFGLGIGGFIADVFIEKEWWLRELHEE